MGKHVAFFLEQAYGHIIPTLGLAAELKRRGHRISYAVTAEFAPAIARSGASPIVFKPLETRTQLCEHTARSDGTHDFNSDEGQLGKIAADLQADRTKNSLGQLKRLYEADKPDLVVHDDCLDTAGKALADEWKIPRIRHDPAMLTKERTTLLGTDDRMILMSVPRFFNTDLELFDERFQFIGFNAEGRREFFVPWAGSRPDRKVILACPTTGLLPQVDFCQRIIEAFQHSSWHVVLSVPANLDPVCAIETDLLKNLPDNIELNLQSSNLDILEHACLFIGQGGQGSTLEAIFSGVPSLLLPLTLFHDWAARRVEELGLGTRLHFSDASPERIRNAAESVIADEGMLSRVKRTQEAMHAERGATYGADLVEGMLRQPLLATPARESLSEPRS